MCFALSKLDSRLHIKVIFINQKCVGLDLDVEHLLEPLRSCFNYSHWIHPPTKCQSMQDFVFFKAFFKLFMCFDLSYSTCGL